MSNQLRDVMTRIAERAEPAPPDPTLWSRARRARRRGEIMTASAAGVAMLALATTIGLLVQPDPNRPEPADRPGIPSLVRGVDGDGGLELETDLAVGAASVAIANPTGAFVVTADDGIYHRLDLPGYDPKIYDDPEVRRTGMVGLSLSPDGTRLAYGWHAPLPDETGQEKGFVRSGLRILDLRTGRVVTVANDEVPSEFAYYQNGQDFPWAVVPYGVRWSDNSRFVVHDAVWYSTRPANHEPILGAGVSDGLDSFAYVQTADVVHDTAADPPLQSDALPRGQQDWPGWPDMVDDSGLIGSAACSVEYRSPDRQRTFRLPGITNFETDEELLAAADADPDAACYTSGLFTSDGRAVLETKSPTDYLLASTLRNGGSQLLRMDTDPARTDLLGWIGPQQALAQVHEATGATTWEQDADLVVLDLADADVESTPVGRIDAEGTQSSFSFATDYATVTHPTRDQG